MSRVECALCRHAAAVRRAVRILRAADACAVQSVRHAAVPAPRAHAAAAALPALPVPTAGTATAAPGRLQPLPATVAVSSPLHLGRRPIYAVRIMIVKNAFEYTAYQISRLVGRQRT